MLPKHPFICGLIVAAFATISPAAAQWDAGPDRGEEIADEIFSALNADVFKAVKALDAQWRPLYNQENTPRRSPSSNSK
jgi:hypothetical protein